MHMKKVCCLYRVSTLGQVDKNDIPMQKTACHKFAEMQGWKITEEHSEKGVSGYKVSANDRDAIQDIKRSAMAGNFDILLVFMFDRLGRKEDETPFVVQWFVQQGIEVWSSEEGQQKFDTHVDKLMNYIRFWQASGESEKTSIRTRTRMGQIVQEGRFKGGMAPYGFRLERQGRINRRNHEVYEIVVDPYEASIVQTIFEWYADQGMGTHQIAMQLTRQGIPSKSGSWHPATVLNMLKNVSYIGILRSGESQSEPFDHLRIISDDLYERAQTLIKERSKKNSDRTMPMSNKSQSLLSGNVFCGHCGSRLSPTTSGGSYKRKDGSVKIKKRHCYVCYGKTRMRAECDGASTYTCQRVDGVVEAAVRNLFERLTESPADSILKAIYAKKQLDVKEELEKVSEELKTENDALAEIKAELIKAIRGKSALSKEDVSEALQSQKEIVDALAKRVEVLTTESKRGTESISTAKRQLEYIQSWAEMFDDADLEIKKMIVANLVDRVIVKQGYQIEVILSVELMDFLAAA